VLRAWFTHLTAEDHVDGATDPLHVFEVVVREVGQQRGQLLSDQADVARSGNAYPKDGQE
jgi:hypothetical protein